jgi:hypothetical protein
VLGAAIHELTHGLGMPHDNRSDANFHGNLMNNGLRGMRGSIHPELYPNDDTYLSYGMALALSHSPYFDPQYSPTEATKPALTVSTAGTVTPVNGQLRITFTASDSSGLSVALLRRNGNLIEEMPLSESSETRTFNTPWYTAATADTYSVSVYDRWGNRSNAEVQITPAAGANAAPRPFLRVGTSAAPAGRPITLSASGTADDGPASALRYEWDLDGDGTFDTGTSASNTYTVTYATAATRLVRVRVSDGNGAASISHPVPIRIEPTPRLELSALFDDALPQKLFLLFNKPVGASLSASDVIVRNLTTGRDVAVGALAYDDQKSEALLTFASRLADGRYRASIISGAVTDRFGVILDGDGDGVAGGDFAFDFVHLGGDVNHDAVVDHQDFAILLGNFGQAGKGFSGGDLNYDGVVDFIDFQALELSFGRSLPAGSREASRPVFAAHPSPTRPAPVQRPRGLLQNPRIGPPVPPVRRRASE